MSKRAVSESDYRIPSHRITGDGTVSETRPRRIQLRRTKGWRMPPNTVSVARPGLFGNGYRVGEHGNAEACVKRFRADLIEALQSGPGIHRALALTLLSRLRGKNVACWCREGAEWCHGDVWLELANSPPSPPSSNERRV